MDIDSENNADGRRTPPLRVENTIDPPVTPPTHHRSRSPHQNAPTLTPPPFTPRKANSSMQQLLMSPCANRSLTGAVRPDGVKLIVRNAYLEDDAVHDPVAIMRNITTLLAASNPELKCIPIEISPFRATQPHPATCYISLHRSLANDREPRADLLEKWMEGIRTYGAHRGLQVEWAPSKDGQDKRMWLRLHNVSQLYEDEQNRLNPTRDQPAENKEAKLLVPYIIDVLRRENIMFYNVFPAGNNIIIETSVPNVYKSISEHGSLPIPTISSIPIPVFPVRHNPVHHPYELVIAGCAQYEPPPAEFLRTWIHANCAIDGESVVEERMAPGPLRQDDLY
ncbi:MAG: hypothetical protein NXY57DRAFT_1044954, partial [Lentinula lateritia]